MARAHRYTRDFQESGYSPDVEDLTGDTFVTRGRNLLFALLGAGGKTAYDFGARAFGGAAQQAARREIIKQVINADSQTRGHKLAPSAYRQMRNFKKKSSYKRRRPSSYKKKSYGKRKYKRRPMRTGFRKKHTASEFIQKYMQSLMR